MATEAKSVIDLDFTLMYEASVERLTGPISRAALEIVGNVGPGVRLLDVAAGTGALSESAAEKGASVLATDIVPGMVERLKERLVSFPNCEARILLTANVSIYLTLALTSPSPYSEVPFCSGIGGKV